MVLVLKGLRITLRTMKTISQAPGHCHPLNPCLFRQPQLPDRRLECRPPPRPGRLQGSCLHDALWAAPCRHTPRCSAPRASATPTTSPFTVSSAALPKPARVRVEVSCSITSSQAVLAYVPPRKPLEPWLNFWLRAPRAPSPLDFLPSGSSLCSIKHFFLF